MPSLKHDPGFDNAIAGSLGHVAYTQAVTGDSIDYHSGSGSCALQQLAD
jgi:hypothetical protein